MARAHGDTWDLASSVGATATMVAAARAAASREPRPLIDDPYAEPLVRAVGVDFFITMATGRHSRADDRAIMGVSRMVDNMAVRTRFFDEFFTDAAAAGVRQAVILASGLDCRAFRLPWPQGMAVYEIDQPEVIEFKSVTLAGLGHRPTCRWRTVPVDLRNDWAAALRAAGFDPLAPTAWSAEGLLGYLPPKAQDDLLDTVTRLSAPGSRLAVDCARSADAADRERSRERMRIVAEHWREQGFDLDFTQLTFVGERNDAAQYLAGLGWQIDSTGINDLLAAHGREEFDADEPMAKLRYVRATLEGLR